MGEKIKLWMKGVALRVSRVFHIVFLLIFRPGVPIREMRTGDQIRRCNQNEMNEKWSSLKTFLQEKIMDSKLSPDDKEKIFKVIDSKTIERDSTQAMLNQLNLYVHQLFSCLDSALSDEEKQHYVSEFIRENEGKSLLLLIDHIEEVYDDFKRMFGFFSQNDSVQVEASLPKSSSLSSTQLKAGFLLSKGSESNNAKEYRLNVAFKDSDGEKNRGISNEHASVAL